VTDLRIDVLVVVGKSGRNMSLHRSTLRPTCATKRRTKADIRICSQCPPPTHTHTHGITPDEIGLRHFKVRDSRNFMNDTKRYRKNRKAVSRVNTRNWRWKCVSIYGTSVLAASKLIKDVIQFPCNWMYNLNTSKPS
jgi:hypothetical protein